MCLSRVWILSSGWARLAPAEVEAAGDTQLPQPCDPTQALFIRDEQIILQVNPPKSLVICVVSSSVSASGCVQRLVQ